MIPYEQLLEWGACTEQAALYLRLFGEEGVRPTPALCIQYSSQFNWDWIASRALSSEGQTKYEAALAPHLAAYEAARAPLWAEYRAAYEAARAEARDKYEAALAPHLAVYEAARAPLRTKYEAARAEAFGTLWCQENPE